MADPSVTVACPDCNKRFANMASMSRHRSTIHAQVVTYYQCPYCSHKNTRYYDLVHRHIKDKHGLENLKFTDVKEVKVNRLGEGPPKKSEAKANRLAEAPVRKTKPKKAVAESPVHEKTTPASRDGNFGELAADLSVRRSPRLGGGKRSHSAGHSTPKQKSSPEKRVLDVACEVSKAQLAAPTLSPIRKVVKMSKPSFESPLVLKTVSKITEGIEDDIGSEPEISISSPPPPVTDGANVKDPPPVVRLTLPAFGEKPTQSRRMSSCQPTSSAPSYCQNIRMVVTRKQRRHTIMHPDGRQEVIEDDTWYWPVPVANGHGQNSSSTGTPGVSTETEYEHQFKDSEPCSDAE